MAFTERYFSPSGAGAHDGTSSADAYSFSEMVTALSSLSSGTAYRFNGLTASYSQSANVTLNNASGSVCHIRFYDTTPGDIDDDPTATGGEIAFDSGYRLILAGSAMALQNSTITGNNTSTEGVVQSNYAAHCTISNCTIIQSGTGSGFYRSGGDNVILDRCKIQTASTTNNCAAVANGTVFGCSIIGGYIGIDDNGKSKLISNSIRNTTRHGIRLNDLAGFVVLFNTIRNTGSGYDGINVNSGSFTNVSGVIFGNILTTIGGYGINFVSGSGSVMVSGNSFFSCTSGRISTGYLENYRYLAESSDPVTSSTDFTLISAATSKASAFAGVYRGESFRSYADRGAVQHQDSGSGGIVGNGLVRGRLTG